MIYNVTSGILNHFSHVEYCTASESHVAQTISCVAALICAELKRQEFAKELSKSGERMTSTLAAAQNKYMAVMNKAKGVTQEESEETIRDLIQRMIVCTL